MSQNNNVTKIFLVLNSGSSSEKFSLYEGEDEVCSLYFEGIEEEGKKKFICTITRADGSEEVVDKKWDTLDVAFKEAKAIFEKEGYTVEEAITMFFKACIACNGFPFPVTKEELRDVQGG